MHYVKRKEEEEEEELKRNYSEKYLCSIFPASFSSNY